MKNMKVLIILILISINIKAQQLTNPYRDDIEFNPTIGNFYPETPINNSNSDYKYTPYTDPVSPPYDGEYEISLDQLNNSGIPLSAWNQTSAPGSTNTFLWKSYKIEAVSFPFTMDCAFDIGIGCAGNPSLFERKMYMPNSSNSFNTQTRSWGFLKLQTPKYSPFWEFSHNGQQYPVGNQDLVSVSFIKEPILSVLQDPKRTTLPHTILKHTIYVYCGQDPVANVIVDSISWYSDHTRGRMNYYPFHNINEIYGTQINYDIIFFPEFIYLEDGTGSLPATANKAHTYNFNLPNEILDYNTINYFPYNEIQISGCNLGVSGSSVIPPPSLTDRFPNKLFPAPYMLFNAPARNHNGRFLAGYEYNDNGIGTDEVSIIPQGRGIQHEYIIDRGYPDLDLNWINPGEKLIFNPSLVSVGPRTGNSNQVNLIFPHGYTFKTILGAYPSAKQVELANTAENGGPYDDLRDVPVPVNAGDASMYDPNDPSPNPIDYPDVSTNPSEMYGQYTIINHGKIIVEECVRIFDAVFSVMPGGTMQFNNFQAGVFPLNRCHVSSAGGAILRNYQNIQDLEFTQVTQEYELKYIALNEINAGNYNLAPSGNDYTIEPGNTDVKFEAGNTIRLEPGFSAKAGSSFSAKCHPISYPTSLCASPPNTGNRLASALGGGSKAVQALLANNTNSALRISPNPGTGIFSVQLQNIKEAFSYEVSDVYGRKVLSSKGNSTDIKIDLTEQPQGIYFVSANLDGKQWVEKIIKE